MAERSIYMYSRIHLQNRRVFTVIYVGAVYPFVLTGTCMDLRLTGAQTCVRKLQLRGKEQLLLLKQLKH
jgi:hypothetical protein